MLHLTRYPGDSIVIGLKYRLIYHAYNPSKGFVFECQHYHTGESLSIFRYRIGDTFMLEDSEAFIYVKAHGDRNKLYISIDAPTYVNIVREELILKNTVPKVRHVVRHHARPILTLTKKGATNGTAQKA